MNSDKNFFGNIFSPKGNAKYAGMAIFIVIAIVLGLAAMGNQIEWSNLKKFMPRAVDLATSPLVRDLGRSDENIPATGQGQSGLEVVPTESNLKTPVQNPGAKVVDSVAPNVKPATVPIAPATAPESPRSDMVIISKIGVSAPIVTPQTNDSAKLKKLLDSGAVIYPASAGIGTDGQTILLGHSAPAGWPEIKHDTIFSRIVELAVGDKIIAIYNDRTYNYSVLNNQIIPKGGDIPAITPIGSESLVLVTCWPPGRDLKRLIVEARLDSVE